MRRALIIMFSLTILLSLAACAVNGGPQGSGEKNDSETSDGVVDNKPEESSQSRESTDAEDKKILVVYFSATGNTKAVAEKTAQAANADLAEIVPVIPYTAEDMNYNDSDCRANKEQSDDNARPQISGKIENWDQYDVVLIGHPIWWGKEPKIIDTFIESYDFTGKTLANFCTSGGSGIGAATDNLKGLSKSANWLGGQKFSGSASLNDAEKWIDSLNINLPRN